MSDLLYILSHPLTKSIVTRCGELSIQAMDLPENSPERIELEKRIARLELYKLPKPDAQDLAQTQPIFNAYGEKIGERGSLRRRFRDTRRGRPEEHTIRTRAALEAKLENPKLTWRQLAEKYTFKDTKTLERAVRRLKSILKREGIQLVQAGDYKQE